MTAPAASHQSSATDHVALLDVFDDYFENYDVVTVTLTTGETITGRVIDTYPNRTLLRLTVGPDCWTDETVMFADVATVRSA